MQIGKNIPDSNRSMNILLVQSCSATKNKVEDKAPAMELYDGYFFRIIKKAKREMGLNEDVDISIISAKHGLIDPQQEIEHYDRRMDYERAEELRPQIVNDLKEKLNSEDYHKVVLNLGKDYRPAVKGISEELSDDIEIEFIEGDGIGEKGSKLKKLVMGSSLEKFIEQDI